EVELELQHRKYFQQTLAKAIEPLPELTVELALRDEESLFRFRSDHIGKRLHLREIDLAVHERAPGELARRRKPRPFPDTEPDNFINDQCIAMKMELYDIITCEGMGSDKSNSQAMIDDITIGHHRSIHQLTRRHLLEAIIAGGEDATSDSVS